jgi:UDP-N-acetylglucosamine diphosphorylase/glucosamine-1-phosphate N-acetyltransferase
MKFALFDEPNVREQLLPFTFTRPVAGIRWGILTIAEKWEQQFKSSASFVTESYLQEKFNGPQNWEGLTLINGAVAPTTSLIEAINMLHVGEKLILDNIILAARTDSKVELADISEFTSCPYGGDLDYLDRVWKIFKEAGNQIRNDFDQITEGRISEPINDKHTIVYGQQNVFIEEGVEIKAAILDAENGPIYLGKNSKVEAGATINGPFALGDNSVVNGHAQMRGDISIGPFCKVGGEVSNSVIFGYSNKGHDGFLGNSVLGEWCNIGAGTIVSNLKNNYTKVKIWDYGKNGFINTGEQFCGLMMADHSKTGIGTTFNTGTVVGLAANIFGAGFPRTFIPSFSWGGYTGLSTFLPRKVKEMAQVSMARRNKEFDEVEEAILNHVFEVTKPHRNWDN